MSENKEKKVLMVVENVRIKEYDNLNVTVERYEEVFNPTNKTVSCKWKFKGYASTVNDALEFIAKNELLIDKDAVTSLESYLEQVDKAYAALMEVIKK